MALQWKNDKEDLVLVVNSRQSNARDVEVMRIDGDTGEVKFSRPVSMPNRHSLAITQLAEAGNGIDLVIQVKDALGANVTGVRQVIVRTLAVTADQGDLAAATVAIGTVKRAAVNPATGENELWMETTSAGKVAVKVSNTAAEDTIVEIEVDGCAPVRRKITFT